MNYSVLDAASVLATHLTELSRRRAHGILSRGVNHHLEQLRSKSPQPPNGAVLSHSEIVEHLDVESMGLVQVSQSADAGAAQDAATERR